MSVRNRTKHWLTVALLGAGISGVHACMDVTFDDSQPNPPGRPAFAVGDVVGPASVPRADRNDVPMPWSSTGIGLLAGVPYRVVVSGMLTFTLNPNWCPGAPAPPSIPPSVGPAGFAFDSRRPWKASVGVGSQTTAPSTTLSLQPTGESAGEISTNVKGPGVLWTSRPIDPLYWSCSVSGGASRPAWFVSGTQEIKAVELEPPKVVSGKQVVAPGDTVLFTLQVSWTTNFFIGSGTGWRWVPDTATNTSTLLSCSRLQTTCRVIVRERGHVEVQNVVVEGSMSFDARSPIVEVASARVRIRSSTGVLAVRPAGTGGNSTLTLLVSVESNGGPLPDRSVELTVDGVEQSGGHQHGGTMPPGSLSSTSVSTGASGIAEVTFTADVFGGSVQVGGTSSGAASALETISVRIPGLVELFEAGSVDTIGVTTTHPSNHWGTSQMIGALVALADTFRHYTQNARTLQVNDISLTLGGKFDVAPTPINYNPDGDHKEHRAGVSADIRTEGSDPLTTAQRKFIYAWWEEHGGNVLEHTGTNAHYHLRF